MKSLREKAVMATLGVLALYALAAVLFFSVARESWSKAAKSYANAVKKYESETKLIGEKNKWTDAYETEKSNMPMFAEGQSTDTTWLMKMDEMAARHFIQISTRQVGKEEVAGEVLELTIDVKNWEGAWKPLVEFIHELGNTGEGMFDMRSISFKPSGKKGYLKGSFTLTCAYMRDDNGNSRSKPNDK